jgi:predicted DsbA family dithiol-disulfide isomerase
LLCVAVDLFSDIVCPWCFIGAVRLERVMAALEGELAVELCYHPFLLDPALPPEGVKLAAKLQSKYGVDPEQLFTRVEQVAKTSGIDLVLSRQPMAYSTVAAHTLLRHAHAKGTQAALAMALFRAYFDDAANIADAALLARIAAPFGFEPTEAEELATCALELQLTREQALAAAKGGIRGVPFFVFDGTLAVSGAQSEEVLTAALRRAAEVSLQSEVPPPGP